MNFLSMKYFVVLAEEGSFTKAAEKLHVTQQTLSAHVAGLEKESGAKLFIRHVPLELTDAGRVFYRYARIIRRNEMALERELTDAAGMGGGRFGSALLLQEGRSSLRPSLNPSGNPVRASASALSKWQMTCSGQHWQEMRSTSSSPVRRKRFPASHVFPLPKSIPSSTSPMIWRRRSRERRRKKSALPFLKETGSFLNPLPNVPSS